MTRYDPHKHAAAILDRVRRWLSFIDSLPRDFDPARADAEFRRREARREARRRRRNK